MAYKIAYLNIHDPHHSKKTGEILIQPASEQNESDLFVLTEIDSNNQEDNQFIEELLRSALLEYQSNEPFNGEKLLEVILQKLNVEIPIIMPKKKNWLESMHCFVGVYYKDNLYFSTFGKVKIYLIKDALIKKISNKAPEEEKEVFAYTLSGEVKEKDKLLITTESLTNYISLDKVKKIISTLPPKSSIAHFNNILDSSPPEVSFFSMIIQSTTRNQEIEELNQRNVKLTTPTTSRNSIDELLKVERDTEKILTPPSFFENIKDSLKEKLTPKKEKNELKKHLEYGPSRNIFKRFTRLTKQVLPQQIPTQKLSFRFNDYINHKVTKFKKLSKLNRTLIIIIIVLLLLFSQNLIWQSRQQSKIKDNETYEQLLGELINKQNGIEASLIYNDTVRAKQLLQEIYDILNDLPKDSKDRIAKHNEINESIQVIYERIWKVNNIEEPLSLINFKELNPGVNITNIEIRDNKLYGFNNLNKLYGLDLENNEKIVIDDFNLGLKDTQLFNKNNIIIGYDLNKNFFSIQDNESSGINASVPANLLNIDDLTFYLDKMYLLNKENNQIVRLTSNGDNFVSQRNWLKDDTDISTAKAITVDGLLYVLMENGEIKKLSGGNKRDFPQVIVEPALNKPSDITTTENSDNLYILDEENKRIVVINKESGELANQYYSDKFNELKDFILDYDNNKIYILNDNQVFVIAI
ncbi:hypothetical protein HOE31_00740 [bacterium]|jgi:hypothetical protein|nr:hypothetical protein [bacterium]MBT4335702.1 hypothetical protein [bacterium]MBT4495460.1 hypothetical protein [bacterium]MBT4764258.1 hypothetical protein [bacterium]MBT5401630.1 hypothetical protein [bacterium]